MNSPETDSVVAGADSPAPAAPAARWEDYIDVFFSPAELFRRRADSKLTHPLVTLCVMSMTLYFLMLPVNMRVMQQSASGNPQSQAFFEQWGLGLQVLGGLFVPITLLFTVAFGTLVLWLGCRLFDIPVSARQAALIATYAAFIYLLSSAAQGVLVMLQDGPAVPLRNVSFGVLRFTDDGLSRPIAALLGRLDIFVIWQAIVWAIGLRVIGRVGAGRAAAAAGVAWLLAGLPRVIMSAIPQPAAPPTPPV